MKGLEKEAEILMTMVKIEEERKAILLIHKKASEDQDGIREVINVFKMIAELAKLAEEN